MTPQTFLAAENIDQLQITPVAGGDINAGFCVRSKSNRKYFLKENSASQFPRMFALEAEGLQALRENSSFKIPEVIAVKAFEEKQYLLMEWIEQTKADEGFLESFGAELAKMHRNSSQLFGWKNNNYIGSLVQINDEHESWADFYSNCRLLPLIEILYNNGRFSKEIIKDGERFCNALHNLFPHEKAALLHGDLWSGNFMCTGDNEAAIYDPAVYYGHREMDIAMTKLFGGFQQEFYDSYHTTYPLEVGWEKRLKYAQLYPLLVHAVLFDGHYVREAIEILQSLG